MPWWGGDNRRVTNQRVYLIPSVHSWPIKNTHSSTTTMWQRCELSVSLFYITNVVFHHFPPFTLSLFISFTLSPPALNSSILFRHPLQLLTCHSLYSWMYPGCPSIIRYVLLLLQHPHIYIHTWVYNINFCILVYLCMIWTESMLLYLYL